MLISLTESKLIAETPAFLITTGAAFVALYLLKVIVFAKIASLTRRTKSKVDDSLFGLGANMRTVSLLVFSLYIGLQQLTLPNAVAIGAQILFLFTVALELIGGIEAVILVLAKKNIKHPSTVVALKLLIRIVLWLVALILILSNIGVNVTSLVASLGIGGLAISLALQNVFQDLFSSFSILIDKPFEVGDFIVINPEYSGTVKNIGLKTTRLTTIQGEELVVPNSQLTSEKIQNFKRLNERTVTVQLGVTYETDSKLLKAIPTLLEQCINSVEKTEFRRASFRTYGDSALQFELMYKVLSAEFVDYIAAEQAVNLAIFDTFAKKGIQFAYPTQTLHVVQ